MRHELQNLDEPVVLAVKVKDMNSLFTTLVTVEPGITPKPFSSLGEESRLLVATRLGRLGSLLCHEHATELDVPLTAPGDHGGEESIPNGPTSRNRGVFDPGRLSQTVADSG